jgi:hypothetical protein
MFWSCFHRSFVCVFVPILPTAPRLGQVEPISISQINARMASRPASGWPRTCAGLFLLSSGFTRCENSGSHVNAFAICCEGTGLFVDIQQNHPHGLLEPPRNSLAIGQVTRSGCGWHHRRVFLFDSYCPIHDHSISAAFSGVA